MTVFTEYGPQEWICDRISLAAPIEVLEGDVIGVCLPDQGPGPVEPLDIFEDYSGQQLYHWDSGGSPVACRDEDVNVIDISGSRWEVTSGVALNVNLEIGEASEPLVVRIQAHCNRCIVHSPCRSIIE